MTLCHKANILKYTSGLFLDVGREVAERYPEIVFDENIIDASTKVTLDLNPDSKTGTIEMDAAIIAAL